MERTLFVCKPDCVQRRLVGEVIRRFEAKGLRIVALKLIQASRDLAEQHYAEHRERPFFGNLVDFITGGPVVAGVLEGNQAVVVLRTLMGPTKGYEAPPGTIRGDFGLSLQTNLVHGSDKPESAAREIALWFKPEELLDYPIAGEEWVFAGA